MSTSKKKIKLLAIGHSYVVALNRGFLRELAKQGNVEVTVAAPGHFHGDLRSLDCEPEPAGSLLKIVPLQVYLSHKIHFFFYHPNELKRLIVEQDFDFVYLWEEPYIVSGFQVARELKKRRIPFAFFYSQNIDKKYPPPFSYFERCGAEWASKILCCGELVKENFNKRFPRAGKAEVLPLFVDSQRFKPLSLEMKTQTLAELGLPQLPTVAYLGRLTEEKGLRTFMQAIDGQPADLHFNVLVMGSGPMEAELSQWVSKRPRARAMKPKHDEVPKYLGTCDILLCPSQSRPFWKEQFGRMIVEGFAVGAAVMGSDSGEIPYVIGDAGLILPETDVSAWTRELQRILRDEEARRDLQKRALVRAQEFTASAVAKKFETILLSGLGK